MIFLRSIILLIVSAVITKVFADDSVVQAFQDSGLVSDVVPVAPSGLAKVTYENCEVNLGNELAILVVAFLPEVTYDADLNQYYTLVMVDPDALSRAAPLIKELQHWLVVNIPGNDVKKGQTISSYLPPTPPPGSGPHRYTFLVYKQSSYIDMDIIQILITALVKRVKFSVEEFAKKYNLGNPVFGNFYRAEIRLIPLYGDLL